MSILEEIFAHKRLEIAERKAIRSMDRVRSKAAERQPPVDFISVLRASRKTERAWPALIAEVKQRSPSRGVLLPEFDPLRLVGIYREHGAAAVSVLTDERYFGGSLEYLRRVKEIFPLLPVLCKEFICDPYQVYEARTAGADAVLLITAGIPAELLFDLKQLIESLGMAALIEIHNAAELEVALACQPSLVGVNNRNLHDFTVSLETTLNLRPTIPQDVCVVAESGIHTPEDVQCLSEAGIDAILVGEALVTAADIGAKVSSLAHGGELR
jgi:indole-3-glycerol phosphate synthase